MGDSMTGVSVSLRVRYERVPREHVAWWSLSDVELFVGMLFTMMPAALLALDLSMRDVPLAISVPVVATVAATCFSVSIAVFRRSHDRLRAKHAAEAATGRNAELLGALMAGDETYERVLALGVDERFGVAHAWMESLDRASGATAAEEVGAGDVAIDSGAYDSLVAFSLEYGRWLSDRGYHNGTDANPFRYLLRSRGTLSVSAP